MKKPESLVLASANAGKHKEIADLLAPLGIALSPQSDFSVSDAAETGLSFVENALIKARHACRHTKRAALADDSGLLVDALSGAPGLYSARYAGHGASDQSNREKLLNALNNVSMRAARFHCTVALLRHETDPTPLICQAEWPGRIAESARGRGGFGYDPVFIPDGYDCTAAELESEEKNRISHRGQALAKLIAHLRAEHSICYDLDQVR